MQPARVKMMHETFCCVFVMRVHACVSTMLDTSCPVRLAMHQARSSPDGASLSCGDDAPRIERVSRNVFRSAVSWSAFRRALAHR